MFNCFLWIWPLQFFLTTYARTTYCLFINVKVAVSVSYELFFFSLWMSPRQPFCWGMLLRKMFVKESVHKDMRNSSYGVYTKIRLRFFSSSSRVTWIVSCVLNCDQDVGVFFIDALFNYGGSINCSRLTTLLVKVAVGTMSGEVLVTRLPSCLIPFCPEHLPEAN